MVAPATPTALKSRDDPGTNIDVSFWRMTGPALASLKFQVVASPGGGQLQLLPRFSSRRPHNLHRCKFLAGDRPALTALYFQDEASPVGGQVQLLRALARDDLTTCIDASFWRVTGPALTAL